MGTDLLVTDGFIKPAIPESWDYNESVKTTKVAIYKWGHLTSEIVSELWVAHEKLAHEGRPAKTVENSTVKSWSDYCSDIGIDRKTAWNWFNNLGWIGSTQERKIRQIGSVTVTDEVDKIWPIDCLVGLKDLRNGLVDTCVTSPPYWKQRDYQVDGQAGDEDSVEQYITKLCEIFAEVYRVLDDRGVLWLNIGDAMRDKQLLGIPWRVALALQAGGWKLRSEVIWHKPAPMPDGASDRPTRAHEQLFMFSKTDRYNWDNQVMSNPTKNGDGKPREFRRGNPAHTKRADNGRPYQPRTTANIRDVWEIGMEATKSGHAAAFPSKLIDRPIRACCRRGGVVLDPFMGIGTTAMVSKKNGRHWIGFEINPAYIKIAEKRLAEVAVGLAL